MATVTRDCTVNYAGQHLNLTAGQTVRGGLERYLVATGGPIDTDDGEFDPRDATVDDVNRHLAAAHADGDDDEITRVLELEAAGRARKTVVDPRDGDDDGGS